MTISDRIRVQNVRVLSDNHYTLKTTTFEWRRGNGDWQTPQPSPHFSHNLERLLERRVLAEIFAISLDKRSQANLGHVGNQIVEHASLPEQRMGSMFGRV